MENTQRYISSRLLRSSLLITLASIFLFCPNSLGDNLSDKFYSEGVAALKLGRNKDAIKAFREALRDPKYARGYGDIRTKLAKAYNSYGLQLRAYPRLALEQFLSALEFGGGQEARQNAELAMKRLGKNPESDDDWIAISEHYLAEYKYSEAYDAYKIACSVNRTIEESRLPTTKVPIDATRVTPCYSKPPSWPISCYFHGDNSSYELNLFHKIQEHWIPPNGFLDSELTVVFGLNADGSYSNREIKNYSHHGKELLSIPKELEDAALNAIKNAAPFEPLPLSLVAASPRLFYYKLGEKNPRFGVSTLLWGSTAGDLHLPLKSNNPAVKSSSFDSFMAEIRKLIKQKWVPPQGQESLQTKVSFKIYPDGKVSDLRIEKSSGSFSFDRLAMEAVMNAAPFPQFPYDADSLIIEFTFDRSLLSN